MIERPILFSAPMVRALLDGSKTQTRRAFSARMHHTMYTAAQAGEVSYFVENGMLARNDHRYVQDFCPYGKPGDRLWVRETWYCDHSDVQQGPYHEVEGARELLVYRADDERPYEAEQPVWRPSIHMPRWASRILLEITSVRVERLQDIGSEEIEAEGVVTSTADIMQHGCRARVLDWQRLWEDINGAGSWEANPWVWVIEFRRAEP